MKKVTLQMLAIVFTIILASTFANATAAAKKEVPKETTNYSAERQVESQATLLDGTKINVTVVTSSSDESGARSAIERSLSNSQSLDRDLFSENGTEAKLNSLPSGQKLELSKDAFDLLTRSVKLAAQTNGWFDVTAPSPSSWFSQRDWRRINLDESKNTVSFKSSNMRVDLKKISRGFFADNIMTNLAASGYKNVLVEVGPVKRISGRDIFTPWNVQIDFGGDKSEFAHRAYNYNLTNIGAATITPDGFGENLIDARSKKPVAAKLMRNITVFANDATTATAYALAAYSLGPKVGLRFVEAHPETKGIIVDNSGQFFSSKGFSQHAAPIVAPPTEESLSTKDRGPNDMKQKQAEEARDE